MGFGGGVPARVWRGPFYVSTPIQSPRMVAKNLKKEKGRILFFEKTTQMYL